MPKSLSELIQASGITPADGDSFDVDVVDSDAFAQMTEYLCGDNFTWGGTTIQPPEEITYASGHTFNGVVGALNASADRFFNIRRNGTTPWVSAGSAETTINSATWTDVPPEVTLSLTVLGAYDPGTLKTITSFAAWFDGYNSPNVPPGSDFEPITFEPSFGGSSSPSGSDTLNIILEYSPDLGGFNPTPITSTWPISISRRAYPSGATMLEWEFHDSASYNNPVSASYLSDTTFQVSVWARWRRKAAYGGGGAWTNYGEVAWSDPREDV